MKYNTILSILSAVCFVSAKPTETIKGCWSEKFNIPCCKSTDAVVRSTYDGEWGLENGEWCGLGLESTRPKDDIPPSPPAIIDIDSINDPAAECDITDITTGDSLAKEAPFRFGVGLNGGAISTSTTTSKKMREVIKYQFNSMTYTNLMKPEFVLDKEGCLKNAENGSEEVVLKFDDIVDGLDFALKNNIHVRGHVLVWHTQTPDWFFRKGFNSENEFADVETIYQRLESYIRQYLGFVQHNYPGVIDVWDVVNEAIEINDGYFDNSTGWYTRVSTQTEESLWYKIVGPDYVKKTFEIARKYALPNVKLVYNDYNTFQTYPHDKTQAIIDLMNILRKDNLVDALGMQSYIGETWPKIEEYVRAIERFTEAGLELQITELTITPPSGEGWLEKQAQQYREFFEKVMEQINKGANITSVTVFGIQDGYRFYTSDSTKTRLLDHDLQKKPNYEAIMEVLKANKKLEQPVEVEEETTAAEENESEDSNDEENVEVNDDGLEVEDVSDEEEETNN
jgi:endo-1,4-beta-xylanase